MRPRFDRIVTWLWARPAVVVGILTAAFVVQGGVLACGQIELRRVASENRQLALEGAQAHDAACARKLNIVKGVNGAWNFIDEGGRIPGVKTSLLISGIRDDIEEYDSLAAVNCKRPIPPIRRSLK